MFSQLLAEITGDLLTDSQEIAAVLETIGRSDLLQDTTAVVVNADAGDVRIVWVSQEARPYLLSARFSRIL